MIIIVFFLKIPNVNYALSEFRLLDITCIKNTKELKR